MKIRHGFVSNSSSSSFVIAKQALTELQLSQLKNLTNIDIKQLVEEYEKKTGLKIDYEFRLDLDDAKDWKLIENKFFLRFDTIMDNFELELFCKIIDVDPEAYYEIT